LGIMEDALQSFFEQNPVDSVSALASLQPKTRHIVVASSLDRLEEKLAKAGVHLPTAQTIVSEVAAKRNSYFALSKLIVAQVGPQQAQSAVCVFRETNPQNTDLLCLVAETRFEGSFYELQEQIRSESMAAIKKLASKLPASITRYHAFTDLSITQFNNLKSVKGYSEFDSMIRKAIAIKEQVVSTLSKKTDPFVVKLFKNGITSYTGRTKVEVLENVDSMKVRDYCSYLVRRLNVKSSDQPTLVDTLSMASFIEKTTWKELDFQFKPTGSGSATMAAVNAYLDPNTGKVEFVNWVIEAAFEIGPDIIVSTETRSWFFGLFSETKTIYTKRPAEISQETIKYLFDFFKASAFDKIRALRKV
jgi:hypothetical protein